MTTDTPNPQEYVVLPPVKEATTTFKVITDRVVLKIVNEKHPEITLAEISGYDLNIAFNMEYINSLEDVAAVKEGFATLIGNTVMDILLAHKHQPE